MEYTSLDDIIYDSYVKAERDLEILKATIEEYGQAIVSDLYFNCGIDVEFDNEHGWTDLDDARIEQVGSGWRLVLPDPVDVSFEV